MTRQKEVILGHWVLAMAVILVVAALSIPQIDKYMIARDGPNSLQASGWVADSPFSPIDVIVSINAHTPDQGPLYFLLLNQWGYLVGQKIALGRMLSIYCGLLSLAMAYRLGRDTISPIAGNFAIIIMASNAFYSFYLTHLRMYPLLVLLSATVIWLYLRLAIWERPGRRLCRAGWRLRGAGQHALLRSIVIYRVVALPPAVCSQRAALARYRRRRAYWAGIGQFTYFCHVSAGICTRP